MPEPDLDRLDRIVDGDLVGGGRLGRARPDPAADAASAGAPAADPAVAPDWSRTLLGLLERLLERLDRMDADVEDLAKRVDAAADGLANEISRSLGPAQRAEDALAVLNGQVAGLDGQVRDLRAAFGQLLGELSGE